MDQKQFDKDMALFGEPLTPPPNFEYIASPYSHKDPAMMEERYQLVLEFVAFLFRKGLFVYSPIVHCHPVAEKYDLPRDFNFWQNYNRAMITGARGLFVFMLVGWQNSVGVQWEIAFCKERGYPIKYIAPESYRTDLA